MATRAEHSYDRGKIKGPRKIILSAAATLGGLAAVGGAAFGAYEGVSSLSSGSSSPDSVAVPTEVATPTPSEAPLTPAPTESPVPTLEPTPSPVEVVDAKPCAIIPDEFCAQGELINWTRQGETYKLIGFRLPPNTQVFSPVDALLGKVKQDGDPFSGYVAEIIQPETYTTYSLTGDLYFDDMQSGLVKKGDVIGNIQDTGVKNLGEYNLIFSVTRFDQATQTFSTPEDVLNDLFPGLLSKKPSKDVTYDGQGNPVIIDFYDQ